MITKIKTYEYTKTRRKFTDMSDDSINNEIDNTNIIKINKNDKNNDEIDNYVYAHSSPNNKNNNNSSFDPKTSYKLEFYCNVNI